MRLLLALFFAAFSVSAQSPEVPAKMQFADLTLTIRDDARAEIQKDVDAYTRYPQSFNVKVQRARTYFPIIEKIFAEENVPDDFKYLVIQESALIGDAVSTSNAVGFWQFKDFTAVEMGLRVDKQIDERMNLVSASRAAARYLKKNNTFFDNWLYALQAYQMGAGGVMRSEKNTRAGVKNIEITSKTYWYVKKFLAHKIAYESAIPGPATTNVIAYTTRSPKTLADIAREVSVDEAELLAYNKWVRSGAIPDDRSYVVLVPVKGASTVAVPGEALAGARTTDRLPETKTAAGQAVARGARLKINGINAIRGEAGETPTALAARAGVDLAMFLRWNDISISDRIDPQQVYLLGKKRNRAHSAYHKAVRGETLWTISQNYGVQMKKLRRYNRLRDGEEVKAGTTLWLASVKPKEDRDNRVPGQVVEVDDSEAFAWEEKTAVPAKVEVPPTAVYVAPVTQAPDTLSAPAVADADSVADTAVQTDTVSVVAVRQVTDSLRKSTDEPHPAPPTPAEHVVRPGETLYGIARLYDVAVMDLVAYNGLDLNAGIKPGQVLKLTENQPVADARTEPEKPAQHVVRQTDTLYSIARRYGITIKELMEWNNKKDFNLSVGETLRIQPK